MLRTAAKIFGVVFLLVGILGFVPAATPNGMLLGIFHVDAAHNVVHLLSGAVALWAGFKSIAASRTYFRVFGVVYGLVAILGFMEGEGQLLGFMAHNMADAWLHVAIALTSLALGFGVRGESAPAGARTV